MTLLLALSLSHCVIIVGENQIGGNAVVMEEGGDEESHVCICVCVYFPARSYRFALPSLCSSPRSSTSV